MRLRLCLIPHVLLLDISYSEIIEQQQCILLCLILYLHIAVYCTMFWSNKLHLSCYLVSFTSNYCPVSIKVVRYHKIFWKVIWYYFSYLAFENRVLLLRDFHSLIETLPQDICPVGSQVYRIGSIVITLIRYLV